LLRRQHLQNDPRENEKVFSRRAVRLYKGYESYQQRTRGRNDPLRLRQFQRPTLLVKGTASAKFLHQIIDALAAKLSSAEVVEMPVGHAPQIVSMDRFLATLASFQAGVKE